MGACLSLDELGGLFGVGVAEGVRARIETHLADCADCRDRLRRMAPATVISGGTVGQRSPATGKEGAPREAGEGAPTGKEPSGQATVYPPGHGPEPGALPATPPTEAGGRDGGPRQPGWLDYELQEVLGKGGAGIVYLARQRSLGRLVALKVLLCGAHAGEEERDRFRAEAGAVARLNHPGIVRIHEIGEYEGRLYLSLEYVAGGSLADHLHGVPQPDRQAAHLLATLADAVQHAHDQGIIHRDLKPANVLLARRPPSSADATVTGGGPRGGLDFEPRITDFGLAKHLELEVTDTRTGAVMGTPSYMAPEQTVGTRFVGPAADVYALGAILYECLTGRPPFRADTPFNTMLQVRTEEPVAPRRLNPHAARDLETICLKCLRKDPASRYPSPRELALDLGRFLEGKPILARPVGRVERAIKWARRRPTATALLALGLAASLGLLLTWASFTARLKHARDRSDALLARSDRYFDLAAGAVEDLLTDVAETVLADEPHMEEKRRVLLEKALRYYQSFLADRQDEHYQRQTARARLRVGRITALLDRHLESQAACRAALEELAPASDPEALQLRAECHTALGESLRITGELGPARQHYRAAAALYDKLLADDPAPRFRLGRAVACFNLGIVASDTVKTSGSEDEAASQLRESVDRLSGLVGDDPAPAHRQALGRALINLGRVLRRPDPDGAIAAYGRASDLYGELARELGRPEYRREQGVGLNNLGNALRDRKRFPEAEAAQRRARDLFAGLAASFPAVPRYRHEQANAHVSLGTTLVGSARQPSPQLLGRAREQFEAACALSEVVVADSPAVPDYHAGHALALGNLAWVLHRQGEPAGSACCAAQAAQRLHAAVTRGPDDARYREQLHRQSGFLVNRLLDLDLPDGACELAASLARLPCAGRGDRYQAACLVARCAAALPAGRAREQERWLDRAEELLGEAYDGGFVDSARLERDLGGDLAPLRKRPDVERMRRRLGQQGRRDAPGGKAGT